MTLCPITPLVILSPSRMLLSVVVTPCVPPPRTLLHPLLRSVASFGHFAPSASVPVPPPVRLPPLPPLHHLQGRSGRPSEFAPLQLELAQPVETRRHTFFACLLRVALSTSFRIFKGNLCPRHRRPSSSRTTKRSCDNRTRRIPTSPSSLELPSLNLTCLFSSKQYSISTVYPAP